MVPQGRLNTVVALPSCKSCPIRTVIALGRFGGREAARDVALVGVPFDLLDDREPVCRDGLQLPCPRLPQIEVLPKRIRGPPPQG